MNNGKFLGVFLNPYYVQDEGLNSVFDRLEAMGVTAVVTHPQVARPTGLTAGTRFPPLHVDGIERLLARSLWGRQELQLETFLSFEPDWNRYRDIPYKPTWSPAPPEVDPDVPRAILLEAKRRKMEAHLQLAPLFPPNLQEEDIPVFVDGMRDREPRFSRNACLSSPAVEAYAFALLADATNHYPEADGLFLDWVEFGAYRLQDNFTCFCPHCERKAQELNLDWEQIRHDVRVLWGWLHTVNARKLEHSRRVLHNASELIELLTRYPGIQQFLRFKAAVVTGFYASVRTLLNRSGREEMMLSARGWPPPWNRSSGMDYRALANHCQAVTPKLFTFDYSVLPRWYGQTLLGWNPELAESAVLDALVDWMDLPDDIEQRTLAHYNIPAPEERHPARVECYRPRLDEVAAQVEGKTRFYPFAHAYLPEPQWKRMVRIIGNSRADGMWIQMYGYLSDAKMNIVKMLWQL